MRYAIYHLPQEDLGQWGGDWLGWDLRQRRAVAPPLRGDLPRPQAELTEVPRRYGFHATMKAPMPLADGVSPEDLARALAEIAHSQPAFDMAMSLRWDWGFLALRPVAPPPALAALEKALVTGLDRFRAPLSDADRARRNPEQLSENARAHLENWGYPHVLDLFHYHLTLSGPITADEGASLAQALEPELAPLITRPMPVSRIALVAERPDRHFHLVEEFALTGQKG